MHPINPKAPLGHLWNIRNNAIRTCLIKGTLEIMLFVRVSPEDTEGVIGLITNYLMYKLL